MTDSISLDDFQKVDMRVATVIAASPNEGARKPAYVLDLDFGDDLGIKRSSAQITERYSSSELVGLQVVAVVNFPPIRINGVKSEVLVLGALGENGVILLKPQKPVVNGTSIA
ncbi:MAG: tRNA-binding protein [Pseudomonadota bacterium]